MNSFDSTPLLQPCGGEDDGRNSATHDDVDTVRMNMARIHLPAEAGPWRLSTTLCHDCQFVDVGSPCVDVLANGGEVLLLHGVRNTTSRLSLSEGFTYSLLMDAGNQTFSLKTLNDPSGYLIPPLLLVPGIAVLLAVIIRLCGDFPTRFSRATARPSKDCSNIAPHDKTQDASEERLLGAVFGSSDRSVPAPPTTQPSQHINIDAALMTAAESSTVPSSEANAVAPAPVAAAKKERLRSLDTFRGLSMSLMVFVNAGGGGYHLLDHAPWDGLTFADVLFPWFMWISGASMAFSLSSRGNASRWELLRATAARSLRLLGLGLALNFGEALIDGNPPSKWRFAGVLQYFAVSQLFTVLTVLPGAGPRVEIPFVAAAACGWLAITKGVAVDGCPQGYTGPGGRGDQGKYPFCTGGSHAYIDRLIFGPDRVYNSPACRKVYACENYDPEGILGALNAYVLCWIGLTAGRFFRNYRDDVARLWRLLVLGGVLLLVAGTLCGFSQYGGWVPVNKNQWSTSFISVTAGMGCFLLTLLYLAVDLYKLWTGWPFVQVGTNPVVIYVGSEAMLGVLLMIDTGPPNHFERVVWNTCSTVFWISVAVWMSKRGIVVKV